MVAQAPSGMLYQVGELARILRISRPLALRLLRDGSIPVLRTPLGLRVEHGALALWIDQQLRAAQREARGLAKDA
jgi:hypothetical protein